MKKLRKKLIITFLLILLIFLTNKGVLASNIADSLEKVEYSEDFKNWLELSEEEKKKVLMPRMYDVLDTEVKYKNPLYLTRMLRSNLDTKFSLKDIIANNIVIRDQMQTGECWAFASVSSLETNLALFNYRNGNNVSKVYDFSERHMDYSTTKIFKDNVVNPVGYNRAAGDGGDWYLASSYLTNGSGAIDESQMPFENNEDVINIGGIELNKAAHQVKIDGADVELSYKEFELLAYFMENQGIALSREKILNNVWNYDYFGDARTIDTHVKKLRSKMGEKGNYIKTVWGMGYKFEVE